MFFVILFFLITYLCVSFEFLWGLNFAIVCKIQNYYFGSAVGVAVKYIKSVLFEYFYSPIRRLLVPDQLDFGN